MTDVAERIARRRLDLAAGAVADAQALIERQRWRGALNRLYYGAFYAARALLAMRDLQASKHAGVISLFQEHFVKTGIVDASTARALPRAFEQRLATDYDDQAEPTEADVTRVREDVIPFIAACRAALEQMVMSPREDS